MLSRTMNNVLLKVVLSVWLIAQLIPMCPGEPLAAGEPKGEQSDPKSSPLANRGDAVLEELKSRWKEQCWGQVDTAEFAVDFFRIQDAGGRHISRARIHEFLEQVRIIWQSSSQPAPIRELSASLPIPSERFPNSWLSGNIVIRGEETRNNFKADLIAGALPDAYDTSFTGGVDVFYVANSRQASLFETKSKWYKFGLTHMCYPPPLLSDVVVVQTTPKVVRLRAGPMDFEIDRLSSGVNWARVEQGDSANEYWQCGFAIYNGGNGAKMLFPSVSASVNYVDGYVTNCFMFVKKSVRFNHQLGDGAFRVATPVGTNAVLFTAATQENPLGSMMVKENADDVAKMAPLIRRALSSGANLPPLVPGRSPPSSIHFWLAVFGGVLLILLGLGIFFRSRLKRAR